MVIKSNNHLAHITSNCKLLLPLHFVLKLFMLTTSALHDIYVVSISV